jgi:hypothetical protein
MVDPVVPVLASTANAFKAIVEFGLHWKDVTAETKNFLINTRQVEEKINTAKRLLRQKKDGIDEATRREVESDISTASEVLRSIRGTIESNRVDIDQHDSVGAWNRTKWLLRGHADFLSHQTILNSSVQSLICSIGRLDQMQNPSSPGILVVGSPPSYEWSVGHEDGGPTTQSFAPPLARRQRSSMRVAARQQRPVITTTTPPLDETLTSHSIRHTLADPEEASSLPEDNNIPVYLEHAGESEPDLKQLLVQVVEPASTDDLTQSSTFATRRARRQRSRYPTLPSEPPT